MEKEYLSKPFSIPIRFEKVKNIIDDRFIKVKVWIAHTGENRNRAYFSKEVLESMIPSLANIPILGYLTADKNGEIDFKAHEERLVVEDQKIKLKYYGHAYGMIPAENNARFEFRYGEDGVEREYLVCDGIIWRKFSDVEEVFNRDDGFKQQSMELTRSSMGYTNNEGLFVFTEAMFEGACILGEGVTPAMVSSTIERYSVENKIENELSEMLTEFNTYFSTNKEKGDETVTKDGEIVKDNITDVVDKDNQTPTVENVETVAEKVEEKNFSKHVEEDDKSEENSKGFIRTFELSHNDIRSSLYIALDEHESFKEKVYWIANVYDNHAIVEDESMSKFYKVNYVKHENAVSIGDIEELFPMFLSLSEKQAIDSSRNNFEALEQEVGELREFKSKVELAEKEQKLAQYSTTLSKEEYEGIKNNLTKFSMEDIEKEIGFVLLKKNHFSANTTESVTSRVSATQVEDSNPYGSLSTYFHK